MGKKIVFGGGSVDNRTQMRIFGRKREEVQIAVAARGLRPFACWGCGFETRQGARMSVLCAVRLEIPTKG